jgi:hypothetical protein
MLIDQRKLTPPTHKPPKLHKDVLLMSFENQWHIRKAYKEIIGLNDVDHFSINIVPPNGEMSVISYNPSIVYQIFQDGTYLYNGTISPTYYEALDFYTWDQCYDKRFHSQVKQSLQTKNSIDTGIVIVHRAYGFNILFSFASKRTHGDLFVNAAENNKDFLKMGFHSLDLIKGIYSQYYDSHEMALIKQPDYIKPVCCLPNLTVIK